LLIGKRIYIVGSVLFLTFSAILTGCYKFEGTQTIPTYIKIDSVYLQTIYSEQGEASQKITDVWVYVDDQQIGVFELPALFPVLATGKHKLEIKPGIKLNGISSTRVPYPFYKPIIFENFDFYPDSIIDIGNIKTVYFNNLTFVWMEDFESSNLSIQESSQSDTTIVRTQPADNPEAWISDYSQYSGVITLTADRPVFDATSFDSYQLPQMGAPVLMEMNFKTDNYVTIGLVVHETGLYIKVPLLILNYSNNWNKIYINLGPTVSKYIKAKDFRIFFSANKRNDKTVTHIYFDNIKLIYRIN